MIDTVLLGKTRAAVLREIFLNPSRRISFNELVRRSGSGAGAISREVKLLTDAGLVVEQREGNLRFLSAGKDSPVFSELKSFVAKCSGATSVIRDALFDLRDKITVAFIFGSVAKGVERADSDLDLFVVGTAGYSVITERMRSIENHLGRQINVLYFDPDSPLDRESLNKTSMKVLLDGEKLFVIGDKNRLKSLFENGGK